MPSTSIFPFLDLPKEIRLMIYEYLPLQTRRTHSYFTIKNEKEDSIAVIGTYYTIPSNIRRTCRKINAEVCDILKESDVFQRRIKTYYQKNHPYYVRNMVLFCREISELLWLRFVYMVAPANPTWMPTPCDSFNEAVETVRQRIIERWNRGLCPFDEICTCTSCHRLYHSSNII